MSDDSGPTAGAEDEDAFSRAFRERWGVLGQSTPPVVRPDPTSPLPMTDTARLPTSPPPRPAPAAPPPSADQSASAPPSNPYAASAPPSNPYADSAHRQRGEPGPAYGPSVAAPQPGQPYPTYGQGTTDRARPSAAALVIVSLVTMVFTFLFIGLPSLVIGLLAVGKEDPAAKRRLLRAGWVVYAVNWAFVVVGAVLLGVGLALWLGEFTSVRGR